MQEWLVQLVPTKKELLTPTHRAFPWHIMLRPSSMMLGNLEQALWRCAAIGVPSSSSAVAYIVS